MQATAQQITIEASRKLSALTHLGGNFMTDCRPGAEMLFNRSPGGTAVVQVGQCTQSIGSVAVKGRWNVGQLSYKE